MALAIEQAELALDAGEMPVGAVLVRHGEVVASARNRVEQSGDPTAHAELLVIRDAAQRLGRFALSECTLYATVCPCDMCRGGIAAARIPRVVYGAPPAPPPKPPRTVGGILKDRCANLMQITFENKR